MRTLTRDKTIGAGVAFGIVILFFFVLLSTSCMYGAEAVSKQPSNEALGVFCGLGMLAAGLLVLGLGIRARRKKQMQDCRKYKRPNRVAVPSKAFFEGQG